MFFILLLILTTTSIAGAAAFFSVYGLAHTFSGTFWSVVWMGGSLEAGKLIAASYAYRYWKQTPWVLKSFLIISIFVLMLLTSVGIFGYLSSGYQTDTLSFKQNEQQVLLLEKEEKELQSRKKEIDKQIAELPPNFVRGRRQLIDSFQSETGRINKRLPELTAEVQKLKSQQIQAEAHVGPIIYIAKVFDMPTDNATKWLIFLLIFVFDPLAVTLTICVNIALKLRKDEKDHLGSTADLEYFLNKPFVNNGSQSSDVGGSSVNANAGSVATVSPAGENVKRTDDESSLTMPSIDNVSAPFVFPRGNWNDPNLTSTAVIPSHVPLDITSVQYPAGTQVMPALKPQDNSNKGLKFQVVDEDPKEDSPEWLERFKRRSNIVESMRTDTLK